MLQHAALEIARASSQEEALFWRTLGFAEVPVPESLGDQYTWFEREGSQIHLIEVADPVVPSVGHVALVAEDLEATIHGLRDRGFEVERGRELWGEPRAKATSPGGHTVELMAAAPPAGQS